MRAPLHPGEFRFEACALDADGVARELLLEEGGPEAALIFSDSFDQEPSCLNW